MSSQKLERLAIISRHPVQYYAPLFRLMAQRHDIKVFYYRPRIPGNYDKGFNCRIAWDVPLLDGYSYEFTHNLKDITKYRPTAIMVYGWAYLSHLRIIMHFSKKLTLLFRGDSNLLDESGPWKRMIKTCVLKKVFSKVHHALYVGCNNKIYFQKYGLQSNQLVYVPQAVDNERFSADRQPEATRIRTAIGVREEDVLILYTGKFIPKKNPEILLRAFSALQLPGVHLLFVGAGILEQKLKQSAVLCQGKNLRAAIHFLPFQNQQRMPAIYQSCDLFCMPSKGPAETWGLAINEAMAAGKAILASSMVGSAIDLIDDGNGRIFQARNLDDLKSKLFEMLSCKAQLAQMGKASKVKIRQWTYEHQIKAIYGI